MPSGTRPDRTNSTAPRALAREGDSASAAEAQSPLEDAFDKAVAEMSLGPNADRRTESRRALNMDRARTTEKDTAPARSWLPAHWTYVNISIAISVSAALAIAREFPPLASGVLILLAVLGGLPFGRARIILAEKSDRSKAFGVLAMILLPMFCFGAGMASWVESGGIGWDVAIASLLFVTAVASAYLHGFPKTIFLLKLAIWLPVTFVFHSPVVYVLMLGGLVITAIVAREQLVSMRTDQERREAQSRVHSRARDILADYEETGQGWFWETDRRSLLTYVSPPVAKAVNRNPDHLVGQPLTCLFDLADTGDEGERTLLFHLSARSSFSELPVRAAIEDEEQWWSVSGRPIFDKAHRFVGFRGSGTDLTVRKRSQEQVSRLARYDALTGLANRYQMSQALETILTAPAVSGRRCAILLLDLDRFKQVNDTLGHPAGDAMLKQVAQRLARAVGKSGQVGRLGGDEFKVIVPGKQEREVLANLAADIIYSLSQPYSVDGHRVVIGASVGIAMAPEHGANSEELIRNADLALYAAKDGGRGRFQFYAPDLHAAAEARAVLEKDLQHALANQELELRYQPVVALEDNRISGFEALLRWNHPTKGEISPAQFIGIAEDTGLIHQIGEWALRQACEDLSQWPAGIRVAVNVSPLQFANSEFADVVRKAVGQLGIDAARLELEITESVFLGDDTGTESMFAELKQIGVRLALDDFGTGYSSLAYLNKAPFDKIKIDRSFVRGITQKHSRNGAIIASITGLARSLGMETTAEGVETHAELDLIREYGCSHVQGFIFDAALTAAEARERIMGDDPVATKEARRSRAPRQDVPLQVALEHDGQVYNGLVRNISATGAMIEGLWNVPVGTDFELRLAEDMVIACTTRWAIDDRIGVEFARPLQDDGAEVIAPNDASDADRSSSRALRQAG